MNKVLQIQNLTVGYQKTPVLKGLNLTLEEGKLYALVGPNGSGKSTLLKTILKETTVQEGTIEIKCRNLAALKQRELASYLSFVPQKAIVPEGFTVEEVLAMAGYAKGQMTEEAIEKALEECGIHHLAKRKALELSGGELQLVLLARAILFDTPLILLDEPTSSLDIANSTAILRKAKEKATEGKTILMSVHDLNTVLQTADEVIVLSSGSVYCKGTPEEVITEKMVKEVYHSQAKLHRTTDGIVFLA